MVLGQKSNPRLRRLLHAAGKDGKMSLKEYKYPKSSKMLLKEYKYPIKTLRVNMNIRNLWTKIPRLTIMRTKVPNRKIQGLRAEERELLPLPQDEKSTDDHRSENRQYQASDEGSDKEIFDPIHRINHPSSLLQAVWLGM